MMIGLYAGIACGAVGLLLEWVTGGDTTLLERFIWIGTGAAIVLVPIILDETR